MQDVAVLTFLRLRKTFTTGSSRMSLCSFQDLSFDKPRPVYCGPLIAHYVKAQVRVATEPCVSGSYE